MIDVALFPFIRQCAHVDINWFNKSFKSLSIWLDMFTKSNLFLSVMDKYEIWEQNQKGHIIKYLNNFIKPLSGFSSQQAIEMLWWLLHQCY